MRRPLTLLCAAVLLWLPGGLDAQTGARAPMVRWAGDRLTVQAVNTPLQDILEQVASQTGIIVTGADRLAGRRSVDIRDATLHDAIRVLFEHVNYLSTMQRGVIHVRIHSMTGEARSNMDGPVHIPGLTDRVAGQSDVVDDQVDVEELDEDEADELEGLEDTLVIDKRTAVADLTTALESEYISVKLRALQLLGFRSAPDAIPALIEALGDEDLDIALTASDVLAAMPGAAPLEALLDLLVDHTEADVQFAALRALALRADLSTLPRLRVAVPHTDPLVREQAALLLKELERRATAAAGKP